MLKKPPKKIDIELFALIEEKIQESKYIFDVHVKERQTQRNISQLDVLNILEGKKGFNRKRNKVKDSYDCDYIYEKPQDWRYCIEGKDIDDKDVRIILTFDDDHMPIITVIDIS